MIAAMGLTPQTISSSGSTLSISVLGVEPVRLLRAGLCSLDTCGVPLVGTSPQNKIAARIVGSVAARPGSIAVVTTFTGLANPTGYFAFGWCHLLADGPGSNAVPSACLAFLNTRGRLSIVVPIGV